MDRLANGGPCDRRIIDFMECLIEYLIDKASGGVGGGPSGNGASGGTFDKRGTSTSSSSSSSSSADSLTTSKKNREDMDGVMDLLKVIASQGVDGKDKAK